jgi:hypothetical protein
MVKPIHMGGGDVDGVAYTLYRPMIGSCQLRGQGLPSRHRLVLLLVLGSGSYRETWSFPGVDIGWRVDYLDTCKITYGKLFLPSNTFPW